jgi:hypothetical protein
MARNQNGPAWNQEAIMAAGFAFAGMVLLQSKLFPPVAGLHQPFVGKLAVWWPVLLIAGGLALWLSRAFERRSRKNPKSSTRVRG